jgi:ABC-type uncharacterized transport system ATPase subunit
MMGLHEKLKTRISDLCDAEYIRLEYGMARIRRPKLVIVNPPPLGLNPAAYQVMCNRLKKDCQKKAVTVIVLQIIDET